MSDSSIIISNDQINQDAIIVSEIVSSAFVTFQNMNVIIKGM